MHGMCSRVIIDEKFLIFLRNVYTIRIYDINIFRVYLTAKILLNWNAMSLSIKNISSIANVRRKVDRAALIARGIASVACVRTPRSAKLFARLTKISAD